MNPIETVKFLEQKAHDCIKVCDHLKHVIEAYHLSYHQSESFLNCPSEMCRETKDLLFEVTKPPQEKSDDADQVGAD